MLDQRRIRLTATERSKIKALSSDSSREDLGIQKSQFLKLLSNTTLIIHAAWAVNFNLGVRSFEQQCIRGTRNLVNLSLSVQREYPARFVFCSSISTATGYAASEPTVPESIVDFSAAQQTGYAQSKAVAEHVMQEARDQAGADCCILRIGQIVGSTEHGDWNPSEATPLMISTAEQIGLPMLNEECTWLPVDVVADIVIETGCMTDLRTNPPTNETPFLYNILHPRPFKWSALLDALREAGLQFEAVEPAVWLQRLRESDQDPTRNPPVKLLSFWEERYGAKGQDSGNRRETTFSTKLAQRDSSVLNGVKDAIELGLIDKFVASWRREGRIMP